MSADYCKEIVETILKGGEWNSLIKQTNKTKQKKKKPKPNKIAAVLLLFCFCFDKIYGNNHLDFGVFS